MQHLVDPQLEKAIDTGQNPGINILPGPEDDGWVHPPAVILDDGSTLQLYKDGEALRAAYDAIQAARHRICLEVYIFASDATGQAIADLLCQKSREGVLVNVIYDSFGSLHSDKAMFEKMRAAKIKLLEFHPLIPGKNKTAWRPLTRNHRKLLVIDNQIAWMGGLNIGAEYAGSWIIESSGGKCDFWRDTAIGITGPTARFYLQAFSKTWSYLHRRKRLKCTELAHNLPLPQEDTDQNHLALLASAPCMHSPVKPLLNRFIKAAKSSIDLTMAYFAPHDDLIDQLCRAAKKGVRVRLMLPGRGDVKLLMIAARSFYETLLTAGVKIYERQHAVLHAKTMVVDSRLSVVGSMNLDYRSIEHNLELSTLIRSRQFGRQLQALFENDIQYARQIKLNHWRHRPTSDRIIQWAVSRARYLL